MRYQANGTNPTRRTTARNGLTTSAEAMNAMTKPMAISTARSGARWCRTLSRLCAKAAIMVGIARKNENSAAAARSRPTTMPPTIVAPDRETPGTSASTWHAPIARAFASGVRSASSTDGAGRYRSTSSITMPPSTNVVAMTPGLA